MSRGYTVDCPNCSDLGCDICQPAPKPAEQSPSQAELLALLSRCRDGAESLEDTATAVRKLFTAAADQRGQPETVEATTVPDLAVKYVELAENHGLLAEMCRLVDYEADKGRVPEYWKPLYLPFFEAAAQLGAARAMAALPQLEKGVPAGFQKAQFEKAYRHLVPDALPWHIGVAWRSFEAQAQRDAILQAALAATRDTVPRNQVTMTGHQLKRALELTWPPHEDDPDRGFTVVTISLQPAGPSCNEDGASVDMPAGLYLSFDDIPEEGMQHLPEEPDPRAPSAG